MEQGVEGEVRAFIEVVCIFAMRHRVTQRKRQCCRLEGVEPHRNRCGLFERVEILLPYGFSEQFAGVGYEFCGKQWG
jgi:hypothetical protein